MLSPLDNMQEALYIYVHGYIVSHIIDSITIMYNKIPQQHATTQQQLEALLSHSYGISGALQLIHIK